MPEVFCPFCEIKTNRSRDIHAETAEWFATTPIGPIVRGHTLVIPKRHIENPLSTQRMRGGLTSAKRCVKPSACWTHATNRKVTTSV